MTKKMQQKRNALALLPLFIFIFLGVGIWLKYFYTFPCSVVVLLGIFAAFLLFKQATGDKVDTLINGVW